MLCWKSISLYYCIWEIRIETFQRTAISWYSKIWNYFTISCTSLLSSNLTYEKQRLARATLVDLTYDNMKQQLKPIYNISSIQSENSFQIKSELSYLAETKSEHPTLCSNILALIRGDSIIIEVVIIISIGVPDRVNPVTAKMKQIHECQSLGINGNVK